MFANSPHVIVSNNRNYRKHATQSHQWRGRLSSSFRIPFSIVVPSRWYPDWVSGHSVSSEGAYSVSRIPLSG